MSIQPQRERPTARAHLNIAVKHWGKISAKAEVPEAESRSLLDIPRRALDIAGPALTLWIAFKVGLPWWAAVSLAVVQMVINGVGHCLEIRRATRPGTVHSLETTKPASLESAETEDLTKRS